MRQKYFAYGSNMSQWQMAARGCNFTHARPARMYGWEIKFSKKGMFFPEGFANIHRKENSCVEGVLYEGHDLFKYLDKFEGRGTDYELYKTSVYNEAGVKESCNVYVALPDKVCDKRLPTRDYLERCLEGEEFLSDDYFVWLSGHETAPEWDDVFSYKKKDYPFMDYKTPKTELRVFVYGTLKRGYGNNRLMKNPVSVEKAECQGEIYPGHGFPYAWVPHERIQGVGTGSYVLDANTMTFSKPMVLPNQSGKIVGELYTFKDWSVLEGLDHLEGFMPDDYRQSHYNRVLTTVYCGKKRNPKTAWIYIADKQRNPIKSGIWNPRKEIDGNKKYSF